MTTHELAGYTIDEFSPGGSTRTGLRAGKGPAVLIMAEIPGITPRVAEFGRKVADVGCTAVLPSLFGTPGRPPSLGYIGSSLFRACMSREFTTLIRRRTSRITDWVRALAAYEHGRCGGPGVGAVGMCFTGGFALGMMLDERVLAPVLSQPSLPLPLGSKRRQDLGISNHDLDKVKERVEQGVCILGLRFTNDSMAPSERFERLREEFGEGFIGIEIDNSPGNPHRIGTRAHSVLTEELTETPEHPTKEALDTVLEHLTKLLIPE